MSEKLYLIYCSNCNTKQLSDGTDLAARGLMEVKTCRSCGGLKQVKCPNCGFLAKITKAKVQTADESMKHMEKIREEQKEKQQRQRDAQRRILQERRRQDDDDDGAAVL